MKLRYFFSMILSFVLLLWGCEQVATDSFSNIKLSQTYLSIPEDGGSVSITVDATESWEFVTNKNWPEVIGKDDKGNETRTPSWLSVDVMSGNAGTTNVTFTATKAESGREMELTIKVGNNNQYVRVRQGSMTAVTATAAEVNAAPDGKNFIIKGKCISIENTQYGNWWLEDETGKVYIYGTLDANGKTKNFASIGLEVGDVVEIEGPKGSYKGDPQMVNVTVLKLTKAMLTMVTPNVGIGKSGGEVEAKVAYKGNGPYVNIPEESREWITFLGMDYKKGNPTKIEPNPADTAIVKFSVLPNTGEARVGKVEFTSYGEKNSTTEICNINQASGLAYFTETFAESLGNFTMNDVTLPEGSTYVWKHDVYGGQGYAKASAFVGGAKTSESWLTSPLIDLSSADAAYLSFEHTGKFFGDMTKEATVWAKAENGEWAQLEIPTYMAGSDYVFVNSGNIDLKAYIGGKMQFAFKYVSSTKAAGTWEVKNVMVK